MTNVWTIFQKQIKDTFKNKTVLIQFIMFPTLAVIMENAVRLDGMPDHFFVKLFAVMYVGMAPLTSMSAILSEEKEKNTLRVLMMSNVRPVEYLVGVGLYIWAICMLGIGVFGICGEYSGKEAIFFLSVMAVGIFVSILIGAAIGTWSPNQMAATSVTVPVMMVFSFLPMLSMFNESIKTIAGLTYSQQLSVLIEQVETVRWRAESVAVIGINAVVAAALFGVAYRKSYFFDD